MADVAVLPKPAWNLAREFFLRVGFVCRNCRKGYIIVCSHVIRSRFSQCGIRTLEPMAALGMGDSSPSTCSNDIGRNPTGGMAFSRWQERSKQTSGWWCAGACLTVEHPCPEFHSVVHLSFTSAMAGGLAPWKMANAINEGFFFFLLIAYCWTFTRIPLLHADQENFWSVYVLLPGSSNVEGRLEVASSEGKIWTVLISELWGSSDQSRAVERELVGLKKKKGETLQILIIAFCMWDWNTPQQ